MNRALLNIRVKSLPRSRNFAGPQKRDVWCQRRRHVCYASASSIIPISDFITIYGAGDEPHVCSPLPAPADQQEDRNSKPVMVYLPGIDGTGLAAAKQFPMLMKHFNLVTFVTPPGDRTSYEGLLEILTNFIESLELPPSLPVYVMGESFGGLLALSLASRCPGMVDRVVLVNPATSFSKSLWPQIAPVLLNTPREAYGALPLLLAPVLGNPINLLQASLDDIPEGTSLVDQAIALVDGAFGLLNQLPILADILPRDTLAHKLELLKQGCEIVEGEVGDVKQRVFVLVGDQDLLLPSEQEGSKLQSKLARAHVRVERGRSHALLQEGGVDLVSIMKEEGFYVSTRRLSVPAVKRYKGSSFGTSQPIELPTDIELGRYSERVTSFGRRLTSPVFISTYMDGNKVSGLGALPMPGEQRPILFVGNHQSLALDMGVFCEEILKTRGIMLRGLAHPAIFASARRGNKGSEEDPARLDAMPAFINALNGRDNNGTRNRSFEVFLEEFGAVPVGPTNFVRLLQGKEAILLYPGGVKEAYRKKGQEYQLFWPQKSEFVRMAAKYDAIIVPFAGVGVDDGLNIVLDSDEMKDIPFLGQFISQSSEAIPQARRGVNADSEESRDSFVSPIAVPKLPPNRLYYMFQKPIELSKEIVDDREACEQIYRDVKKSVEDGIEYLLEKRNTDPYSDFGTRLAYESFRGTAPTFPIYEHDDHNNM
ncbi:hypothetical protein M9434_000352 [Picochlorum sp. BPE23]|nr:hypothetical protein M9434_000352 [Picochlorum sp. BPE23]